MPRKFLMRYEGKPNFRWVKMLKGVRHRVACADLHPTDTTELGTYQRANEWWMKKLVELQPSPKTRFEQIRESLRKKMPDKTDEDLEPFMQWLTGGQDDPLAGQLALKVLGVGTMPRWLAEAVLGKQHAEQIEEAIAEKETLKPTIADAVEQFLKITATQTKPRSHYEMSRSIKWFMTFTVKFDEAGILEAYNRVSALPVLGTVKRKKFGFFKRLVRFLVEQGIVLQPANLESRLLRFKVKPNAIKTFETKDVIAAVSGLPEKLKLFALLGLNCGMTNSDIGALKKDQVEGGYLTRKRVKTEENANVPMVKYKLWKETARLLQKYKSNDANLWFTSESGAPLVHSYFENGSGKVKDLITRMYAKTGCTIPLSKFRSISATMLDNHEVYGRFALYFLAHSPKSIKDKHYVAPSQQLFDKAIDWLGTQFGY